MSQMSLWADIHDEIMHLTCTNFKLRATHEHHRLPSAHVSDICIRRAKSVRRAKGQLVEVQVVLLLVLALAGVSVDASANGGTEFPCDTEPISIHICFTIFHSEKSNQWDHSGDFRGGSGLNTVLLLVEPMVLLLLLWQMMLAMLVVVLVVSTDTFCGAVCFASDWRDTITMRCSTLADDEGGGWGTLKPEPAPDEELDDELLCAQKRSKAIAWSCRMASAPEKVSKKVKGVLQGVETKRTAMKLSALTNILTGMKPLR
eukprot:g28268.t1